MSNTVFALVLASAFVHASWNIAAKRTAGNLAVLWLAQVLAAAVAFPFALWRWSTFTPTPASFVFLCLTGVIQALYFLLLSKAYYFGDLSVVYPIARGLGVAGTALSSAFILREGLSAQGLIGVATVCAGTILLGMRRMTPGDLAPFLYAGAIGLLLAVGATVDKLAVSRLDPVIYIFFMFAFASLIASPFIIRAKQREISEALRVHRKSIAIVGFGSMGGYLIALFAFRQSPLAYVSAIRESSVLLGAIWGYVVMKETFTRRRGVGMAFILAGLVLIRLA